MSLKHWWQLNGSLVDCVGGNDLVASGSFSSNDSGKIGRCYFASATSAYAASKNAIYRNGDLSLCFWFKLTAITESPTALVTLHDHTTTSNIGINLGSSNKLGISIGYTDGSREWSGRNSATVITTNTWYHACVTFNQVENRITVYVNGVKENSEVLTKTVKFTADKLTVNRWSVDYGGYMSTCYYNDIRFYDHALSVKEIKEISKGLILHYNFNIPPKANIVCDSSGFGNHSSAMSAAPIWNSDSSVGSYCISNIDGNSKYIQLPASAKVSDAASISFWLRIDNNTNAAWTSLFGGIRDGATGAGQGISIHLNTENKIFSKMYGASVKIDLTANKAINTSGWNHIVISNASNAHTIYLNGAQVASGTTNIGALNWAEVSTLYLGRAMDNHTSRSLSIDDFRIYATALTQEDVTELYQVRGSVAKNGKLFVNEIVEDTKGILTYDEIGVSGLTNVTMTKAKSTTIAGGAIVSNTGASSGAFRISLPKAKLIANKDMVFSFNYRFITGSSLTVSDWCDGTVTTKINNGCMKIQGSRSSYDDTYRFVDFNIGASTSFEMWNFRLYQGTLADTKSGVNKKGILNTDEIIEVEDCSMKTKTEHSANWVRIFYHNSNAGAQVFSSDKSQFLKCHDEFKQSDLWALEQFRGKDGKFELMLQYQNSSGYNRWKQSSNFTKETIKGYEAVSCSWTNNYWGGLEPDTGNHTWVDGSVNHGNWYYAIGSREAYQGGMPGPNGAVETGWVEIWVRCDDMNLFRMIKNGKCKATEFIEI